MPRPGRRDGYFDQGRFEEGPFDHVPLDQGPSIAHDGNYEMLDMMRDNGLFHPVQPPYASYSGSSTPRGSTPRSNVHSSTTALNTPHADHSEDERHGKTDDSDSSDWLSRADSGRYMPPPQRRQLHQIASRYSQRYSTRPTGSILDPSATLVDPKHKDFDLGRWIQMFLTQLNGQGVSKPGVRIAFEDLTVTGSGAAVRVQETVADLALDPLRKLRLLPGLGGNHTSSQPARAPKLILNTFNGLLRSGELLIVLGRPGSGCSTLLKTLCGELHGLKLADGSQVLYNGITQKQMMSEFAGDVVYNQEVDKHFPHLMVGQTLEFAASVRAPAKRAPGMSRQEFAKYVAQVVMAVCGLTHTYYTKVGNDFVRGVSGGERKRVSIAEMMVAGSAVAAWDNSTRGLDSATALKFVQNLRLASDLRGMSNAVAIYQASQAIYDVFDKATVLYEGRQIYFGAATQARNFFERQGWLCPPRQTTGDFLTSVTNPLERRARPGFEKKVPRTPQEFEQYWLYSPEYRALRDELRVHAAEVGGHSSTPDETLQALRNAKHTMQSKHVRPKSSYVISIRKQIALTTRRAYQRLWNDKAATLTTALSNFVMAMIVGSVYYGVAANTASFGSKGAVLFVAILTNALASIAEIGALYAQRPIVEKQTSYRFYHPATEAIAGVVSDIPIKFVTAVAFNLVLYFLSGLRREAGPFFLYFLVTFISTFVMSAVFRTMAAITKTVSQAMTLSGVLVLALVMYTGYVVAVPQMHPWFGWIRFINPIFYAFEILVANEFHHRRFSCSAIVPAVAQGDHYICSTLGAVAGQMYVSGDAFIAASYEYYYSHVWRNFGILIVFLVFFMLIYFVATELNSTTASTAEVLVFRRGHVPRHLAKGLGGGDVESANAVMDDTGVRHDHEIKAMEAQTDVFTWRNVTYDIETKAGPRRLLDEVSGWVKPGTLTALMGVSGAGKTTLLDVLAQRTSIGVITGDMLVNGKPQDASFQRKTGYVQQQDLHLETATVRESLRFSAVLRQPSHVSKAEKYAFVEEVIKMLNMEQFADAVVGIPGEGLNVEQRKLLTIGVELAAKPKLLLFLDEPTSGLDSQSSWAICSFLRKLTDAGQAVLCTIHQPSAILFQEFDRLLFLARGGRTVYFGDIGPNSRTLLDYFARQGAARRCGDDENPAEYMIEVVNHGTNGAGADWHDVWRASPEREAVDREMDRLHHHWRNDRTVQIESQGENSSSQGEFAAPFTTQLAAVTHRIFQQYWRMPEYIMAKWALGLCAGLFIGFSFYQGREAATEAGMRNVIFGVFMITTIFTTLVQQVQPLFVTQRALYEVRERPSKAYSWKAFLLANILVEIPYQIVTGVLVFACVYYPIAGVQASGRQVLILLFVVQFFIYASTFAHMTIAALPDTVTAGAVVTLLVVMSLLFCGVLQTPEALPGFWIFMYRLSPFTYWIAAMVATQLHGRPVVCSAAETLVFSPPANTTCGDYLAQYLAVAPGTLEDPASTDECRYCSISVADQFLAGSDIYWDQRWRNFGILWVYVGVNVAVTVALYYAFRVAKYGKGKKKKTS